MPNTSATGGYLRRTVSSGTELRDFLHDWIVGLTGLDNTLVRPRWQPNPPPMPDVTTDWCAFGIVSIESEKGYPSQTLADDGLSVYISGDEKLEILLSFYGPNSLAQLEQFSGAVYVLQNNEPLLLRSLGLQNIGSISHAPELINNIYYDRYDLTLYINREITQTLEANSLPEYEVLALEGAQGNLITENLEVEFMIFRR